MLSHALDLRMRWGRSLLLLLGLSGCWIGGLTHAADVYRVDPDHTFTYFAYSHWGLSIQQSRFERHSGRIELDPQQGTGRVELKIETESIRTGVAKFDELLRSASFFDAATYPHMVFRSTALRFDEGQLRAMDGVLTIRNIERAVTLDVQSFNCRWMPLYLTHACGANGRTVIKRSDFGMGAYAPFVSDEVTLRFAIEAIRE